MAKEVSELIFNEETYEIADEKLRTSVYGMKDDLEDFIIRTSDSYKEVIPNKFYKASIDDISIDGYLVAVAFGEGTFCAISDDGTVLISKDGFNWKVSTLSGTGSTGSDWVDICYGRGRFVAISNNGFSAVSIDGFAWSQYSISNSSGWTSIAYGNSKFVAVSSSSGRSAYSIYGNTWTATTLPSTSYRYTSIAFAGGLFCAVSPVSSFVAVSTAGTSWRSVNGVAFGPVGSGGYLGYPRRVLPLIRSNTVYDLFVFLTGDSIVYQTMSYASNLAYLSSFSAIPMTEGTITTVGVDWCCGAISSGVILAFPGDYSSLDENFIAKIEYRFDASSNLDYDFYPIDIGDVTANTFTGVAYGNGVFVAVTDYGEIFTFCSEYAKRIIDSSSEVVKKDYVDNMYITAGRREGKRIGDSATAEGYDNESVGDYSHAEGYRNTARGDYSHAEGCQCIATGEASHSEGYLTYSDTAHAEGLSTKAYSFGHAEGQGTLAKGTASHAEGERTLAHGDCSHAEGYGFGSTIGRLDADASAGSKTYTVETPNPFYVGMGVTLSDPSGIITYVKSKTSSTITLNESLNPDSVLLSHTTIYGTTISYGMYSHAEGNGAMSIGEASHSEGSSTYAIGDNAHAEGENTTASGGGSHAEGGHTKVSGFYAHAEGEQTTASQDGSHAEGYKTTASSLYTHAEGEETTASGEASHAEGYDSGATGDYSHAEGNDSTASGESSHAEGKSTEASGDYSHAEGNSTGASGESSHAEGYDSIASGDNAHAEGSSTASGDYSHAEGKYSIASGEASHAEGNSTEASGDYSHAEGEGTIASKKLQHVFGKYNDGESGSGDEEGDYIEIVGNGTQNSLSNARTLTWAGNEWIAGNLVQASDSRFKDVIDEEIPDVSSIRAVKFRWNDNKVNHDEKEHIGYLAQDVEEVLPYIVDTDKNGYKSLDYIAFLCAKIDNLEKRILELENKPLKSNRGRKKKEIRLENEENNVE